jgi:hypothetical protein
VIEALSWQSLALQSGPGLDPSWQAGLEMAVHAHLSFGTQVLFTYGPLGFLAFGNAASLTAVWFNQIAVIALLNAVLVRFLLSAVLLNAARRSYGLIAGMLLAIVGVAACGAEFADLTIILIALVWALGSTLAKRQTMAVAALGGAVAAVEALEKVSIGASAVAMLVIYLLASPNGGRVRAAHAAAMLATFMGLLIAMWVSLDQSLSALPSYVYGSYQIASGYSAAMSGAQPGLGWTFTAAFVLGVCGLAAAWRTTNALPTRQRLGGLLLWVIFWFSAFKEGFVRQDGSHVPIFFGAMAGGLFAFRFRREHRSFGALSIALAVCALLATFGLPFTSVFSPAHNVSMMYSNVRDIVSAQRRHQLLAGGRETIKKTEPLPKGALGLLKGRTVAVYPSELALAWAYRLDWRPIPVLQSYSAYTSWLDHHDASFLASSHAPARLILQAGTGGIDGRVLSFDEPETSMQIFCRYRPRLISPSDAILARASNRCAPPRFLGTVRAQWGQEVTVPTPHSHSFVLVDIDGTQASGFAALEGLFYKPPIRGISINGSPANRLVGGTAADGLPVSASPNLDFPLPYSLAPGARTLAVTTAAAIPPSSPASTGSKGAIQYTFYAVSVR